MKKKYKKINQILFNDFSEQKPIKLLPHFKISNASRKVAITYLLLITSVLVKLA